MYSGVGKSETLEHMRRIEKILRRASEIKIISFIRDARVPLIRCMSVKHNIPLDLNFSNGSGTENTKLIRYLFKLQPVVLPLCMFMKCWLKESQHVTTISSYMITMLTIFYLQFKRFLPAVRKLQENIDPETISCKRLNILFLGMIFLNENNYYTFRLAMQFQRIDIGRIRNTRGNF